MEMKAYGIVKASDGSPLKNAFIAECDQIGSVQSGAQMTTSKADGSFALEVPKTSYIRISHIGFLPKIVPSVEANGATIKLDESEVEGVSISPEGSTYYQQRPKITTKEIIFMAAVLAFGVVVLIVTKPQKASK